MHSIAKKQLETYWWIILWSTEMLNYLNMTEYSNNTYSVTNIKKLYKLFGTGFIETFLILINSIKISLKQILAIITSATMR